VSVGPPPTFPGIAVALTLCRGVTQNGKKLAERPASEAAPDEIEELAESCRQYVLHSTGIELDYTPETLSVLDHYLAGARQSITERPELEPLIARSVGAYFGELVRRKQPSFWSLPTADAHDWRLCAREVFLAFNPIGVAYDALADGVEHDGPSSELRTAPEDRDVVAQRLEELPEVVESEYYLLSTRLEVIEAAALALRLDMQKSGVDDVRFEESDYDEED
jgi:hypothetical protein